MKKICLLLIPLLLCSCNTNNKDSSELSNVSESTSEKLSYVIYENGNKNSDGYWYWFNIDYNDNAKLVINRKDEKSDYAIYKTFPFGKYECIYQYSKYGSQESVYDYGEFAIWYRLG